MKIAIIDGVNQDIGLKILFPEADYFIKHSPDCTNNYRLFSYENYKFQPNNNWDTINDKNYDYLFIVLATHDINPLTPYYQPSIKDIYDDICVIINNNYFKCVALFDNYDFDYDPNIYLNNNKIDLIFKRNFNKNKIYSTNVVPFPFIMFGEKSLIEKMETELVSKEKYFKEKENRIFFTGTLFSNKEQNRDRVAIYDKIKHTIYNPGNLPYNYFIECLRESKYSLDLLGAGDPNKRTFEILMSGSLMISEYNDLLWPFNDGDSFSNETIFKDADDYYKKMMALTNNEQLYYECLKNQYNIVKKYFNKEWLRLYICSKLNII